MMAANAFRSPMALGFPGGLHGLQGDWKCPNKACINHVRFVFAKNSHCPQCGLPKSMAMATNTHQGEWQCPNTSCMNHRKMVFGKHSECPLCSSSRNQPIGRPGEWQCPNQDCINHKKMVFA